jgi:peptidoglycan DL-endopeptidase LytF
VNVQRHEIRKLDPQSDEHTLFIYLDNQLTEIASELGSEPASNRGIQAAAKQILKERYPGLKVTMIKVILGGMAVTSFSLSANDNDSVLAEDNHTNVRQTDGSSTTSYTVAAGDTVYGISKKFGTTPEVLRTANRLSSDMLQIGQVLNIPAHGSKSIQATMTTPYTVVSGDTLWSISNRFNTTVSAIRSLNNLTSETLSIGQTLSIPNGQTAPAPKASTHYIVVAGDTLWSLSKRFGTTVSDLKSANNLTSDTLSIGQTLTISAAGATPAPSTASAPSPVIQEERKTFTYAVKSGDNLSLIAKRFEITVDAIRTANKLTSDVLQIGQALTIPDGLHARSQTEINSITYTTHTVGSGDNIWDLSVRYGIPQAELLRANHLTTSSMLSIGQKLKIPVHNIAVKEVVSEKHGEYMDWWTEAQYIFAIGKTAKVTDFATGKSFYIKRTIGANHADSETVTTNDTNIAKSIWGGFSWTPRAVVLEIDDRKIAASMSFMPHEREYIANNGITGHFDVYFGNSTRHVDGKADAKHQALVEKAAGLH